MSGTYPTCYREITTLDANGKGAGDNGSDATTTNIDPDFDPVLNAEDQIALCDYAIAVMWT